MKIPSLFKFQTLLSIIALLFICCIFSACATVKGVTASTTSAVKDFDTSSVVCLFSDCPGYKEFRTSKKLYSQDNYQEALESVELALSKDPKNEKYLKHKKEITLKIQSNRFIATWNEYEAIPKEDLDKKELKLKELQTIAVLLELSGGTDFSLEKVNEEFKRILMEKEEINNLTQKIHDAFATSDCDKGLELFSQIKPFKDYFVRTSKIFPSIENYQEKLDECLDKEYKKCNYEKVIRSINLIDTIAENEKITLKRRITISSFYRDRGTDFLNKKRISTTLMFFALANRYKSDCVDKDLYDSVFTKLKNYNEKLYVEINSSWEEENKKEIYKNTIHEEINKIYRNIFEKTDSISDATMTILINLERVENNIEQSQPQIKYSKFISGYNKVPNQEYYTAQQNIENARAELRRLSAQRTYGWADALAVGFAQGTWQVVLSNNQKKLNSDEVYDQIPILIDYRYTQNDIQINNLVKVSYKIIDTKRRAMLKEDTIIETSNNTISILEGVHPQDNDNLKNSGKFNYNNQRQEFLNYVDSTFKQATSKILEAATTHFEERTKDYLAIGETTEAVDSYLLGYILKKGAWTESIYDVLPADLSASLHELPLRSNLSKKIAVRKKPIVMAKYNASKGKSVKKLAAYSTKAKNSEENIPSLIEESKNKVVFIKSVASNGISQGSGFFVSKRGHIITNYHVIKNSSAVIVKTADATEHVAKVLRSDSYADLALLKIDVSEVSFFTLCDSNKLEVGQTVIAIGAPLGLEQTASKGIISARRHISLSKTKSKMQMIQTDAQMTHGNSGGPLINLTGEVVGVNTLTLNNPNGPQGPVNFAISTNEIVKRIPNISKEDN